MEAGAVRKRRVGTLLQRKLDAIESLFGGKEEGIMLQGVLNNNKATNKNGQEWHSSEKTEKTQNSDFETFCWFRKKKRRKKKTFVKNPAHNRRRRELSRENGRIRKCKEALSPSKTSQAGFSFYVAVPSAAEIDLGTQIEELR